MKQSEKGLTAVIISRSSGRTKRRLTGAYHVVSYTLVLMVVAALTGGCGDGGGLSGFGMTPTTRQASSTIRDICTRS